MASMVSLNPPSTPSHPSRGGRPTRCTAERLARMLQLICERGLSDSAAGQAVGLSRATVGRWKRRDPAVDAQLDAARDAYFQARLQATLARPPSRPIPRGWRGSARLLERAFRGEYSRYALEQRAHLSEEDEAAGNYGAAARRQNHANPSLMFQNPEDDDLEALRNFVNRSHLLQNPAAFDDLEACENR